MTKKQLQPFVPWMPNFKTYSSAVKLGMVMTEMFVHSATVIFHRSPIMMDVAMGKLSITDPKFSALWQEKLGAGLASYNAAFRSMAGQSVSLDSASFEKNLTRGIQTMNAATRPYHTKAKVNAAHLAKKALLGK